MATSSSSKFIERLSDRLIQAGVSRAEARELQRYRQFYLTCPRIWESLPPELAIHHLACDESPAPAQRLPATLRTELSWTHYRLHLGVEDPTCSCPGRNA
ncbi:MAG: hypothetical protein WC935_08625 [Thermoleophilia bacterium]